MPQTALKRGGCRMRRGARRGDGRVASDRAMLLAAFAIERDVQIVVLSEADRSGLERFGFRVERSRATVRRRAPPARTRSAASGTWTWIL